MGIGFRCWLVLCFAVAAPDVWAAKTTAPTEINAYAIMEGYKIPFKMRTEPDRSKNIQRVNLTLDVNRIPPIDLSGPIDNNLSYKSKISRISLCGMSGKKVCLYVLSDVEVNTLIPVSGQMTFYCFFEFVNNSGILSVEQVDVRDLKFESWLNGLASAVGDEKAIASKIKAEIEKQLQAKKLDLSGVGLLSDLATKTVDNNLELALKLKNRMPALKVFQAALAQKSSNRVEVGEENTPNRSRDQTGRTAYQR